MHIADGILPVTACVAAQVVSLGGVTWLGRRIGPEEVVRMGLLASAIFVSSMVHFPLGGTSVHLGLFGLAGILLGRRAFPVIYATLLFQSLLFQHGGLLTLGVNVLNMGLGALAAAALWRMTFAGEMTRAFAAGFAGTALPAVLMALEFEASGYGRGFAVVAMIYSGVALIEAAVTAFTVQFLRRAKPGVLARAAA